MNFYTKSGRQIHYYNEGKEQIDKLFYKLLECYSVNTTYDKHVKNYDYNNNPTYGQCGVTAMIFQDLFGGTIHKVNYLFNETHYFNKLNGKYYDLTSDQFDIYHVSVNYEINEEIDRKLLNNNKILYYKYNELKKILMNNNGD